MTENIWIAIITALSTLIGTLGGIAITSYIENVRRKQEMFLEPKKDLYVRILGNLRIYKIISTKSDTESKNESITLLKKLTHDIEEVRIITKNAQLTKNMNAVITMVSEEKNFLETQEWKQIKKLVREELGIKLNDKEKMKIWNTLKNLTKKLFSKEVEKTPMA